MSPGPSLLSRAGLSVDVAAIAPALLGALVCSDVDGRRVVVRLTEVEAYSGESDPGSHAFRGKTPRNAVMFGPAGHAYVYFVYGMHWCMNVVCGPEGQAAAVLLRAGEVVEGADVAAERRPASRAVRDLASGPARLATALGITGVHNGVDLLATDSPLRLVGGEPPPARCIATGPRVGVGGAGAATPWRYWIEDDPTVSTYRAHVARRKKQA